MPGRIDTRAQLVLSYIVGCGSVLCPHFFGKSRHLSLVTLSRHLSLVVLYDMTTTTHETTGQHNNHTTTTQQQHDTTIKNETK